MDRLSKGKFVLLLCSVIASGFSPSRANAACCLDWLFGGKKNNNYVAYYPPATTTAPATSCGPAQCEQTVLKYVPEVSYRTVWQPIPVTTYRRTVSYNPTTGLPMTCTQPCTSYTYQARRVPYTSYRPTYTTEPVAPVNYTTGYVANVAAPASSCNCGTPAMVAPAAPAASQPYYSTPESTSPAGATPWETIQPNRSSNGQYDYPPPPSSNSSDPANTRPAIPPNIDPDMGDVGSLRKVPSIPREYASAAGSTSRAAASEPTQWSTVRPSYDAPARVADSATDSQLEGRNTVPSQSSSPDWIDLRPLPNLDAPARSSSSFDSDQAPASRDPRDRTAHVRPIPTRWQAQPIVTAERQIVKDDSRSVAQYPALGARRLDARRLPAQSTFSSDQPSRARVDSDGWRSGR